MVYKATLKQRVGIEVFDTEKVLKQEEPGQVVAAKVLQGNCQSSCKIIYENSIFTQKHGSSRLNKLRKN